MATLKCIILQIFWILLFPEENIPLKIFWNVLAGLEKINLMWILRRNLSPATDFPRSTEGPNFTNNKTLPVICWQGLLTDPRKTLRWYSGLPVPRLAFLWLLCQQRQGNPDFVFTRDWDLPSPVWTAQFRYVIYIKQT